MLIINIGDKAIYNSNFLKRSRLRENKQKIIKSIVKYKDYKL